MLAVFVPTNSFAGLATPVAVSTITVPGNTTSLVGVPYARAVEAFGTISSLATSGSDTVLTVSVDSNGGSPAIPASVAPSAAGVTPVVIGSGLYNTDKNVDSFYVCEILDGDAIGLILDVIGGTSTTIIVKGTIPTSAGISASSITSTTKWALRKAHTLTSLFGERSASNPFGYGSGATAATVLGQVQLLDSTTGAVSNYYINKTGASYNWRSAQGGSASVNHQPLGLGKGFLVVNLRANPLAFTVSGDYRTARSRFIAQGGKKYLLANPGVTDANFVTSTITTESPVRATGAPRSTSGVYDSDSYGIWSTSTKAFKRYQIAGTTDASGPSAYYNGARTTGTFGKYTSILAEPAGTASVILTIAPATLQ